MRHPAQKRYLIKIALPTILISCLLLILTQVALAQLIPQRNIVISPPTIEHVLNPGETTEGILKITNNGDTELTFNAGVRDFIVEDKAGTPVILADDTLSNKYSGASWIAVTPNTFLVPAGETVEINYYVQVPADAAPGGHYAAAIYEPIDIISVEGTGAGVNTQLGSLFYVTIPGDITENAEVTEFSAPFFNENPPVTLTTEIVNNSDIHVRPSGSIIVKNLFGQEVSRTELNAKNIFPEASLLYANTLFSDSGWKIGRYTAELEAIYGTDNNIPLTATVSFIIFPWKVAAGAALVIAIAVIIFFLLKKRKAKKNEPQKPEQPATPPAQQ